MFAKVIQYPERRAVVQDDFLEKLFAIQGKLLSKRTFRPESLLEQLKKIGIKGIAEYEVERFTDYLRVTVLNVLGDAASQTFKEPQLIPVEGKLPDHLISMRSVLKGKKAILIVRDAKRRRKDQGLVMLIRVGLHRAYKIEIAAGAEAQIEKHYEKIGKILKATFDHLNIIAEVTVRIRDHIHDIRGNTAAAWRYNQMFNGHMYRKLEELQEHLKKGDLSNLELAGKLTDVQGLLRKDRSSDLPQAALVRNAAVCIHEAMQGLNRIPRSRTS